MLDVSPVVDGGDRPTRSVVGEEFEIGATVFREGHDAVNATLVVTDPRGTARAVPMRLINPGLDRWTATVGAVATGTWTFRVEGWSDPYATWVHDATIKIEAGVDTELMLAEGALLLDRAAQAPERNKKQRRALTEAVRGLRDVGQPVVARLAAGLAPAVQRELAERPLRDLVSPGREYPWLVERERALYGAWYEIFPRSEGAHFDAAAGRWRSGTFRTAAERLPAIADMGFDVVYLTPVHPIGEINRKGRNNSLAAEPGDPGSPYAIGSKDGGHDAIHPDLGTFEDFDAFVAEAGRLGLEVALDLALSAAPDHPWVTSHRSGSPPGPTERSRMPRTRRRSTRTSIRSTSTTTRPASTPRSAGSCGSGSSTACGSSASTTRTPSRSSSGNG